MRLGEFTTKFVSSHSSTEALCQGMRGRTIWKTWQTTMSNVQIPMRLSTMSRQNAQVKAGTPLIRGPADLPTTAAPPCQNLITFTTCKWCRMNT